MTAKDYYLLVIEKLRAGLLPAMEEATCKYRTEDGKACMMGLCIPDSKYSSLIEGSGVNVDNFEDSMLYGHIEIPEDMTINDLNCLQCAHDYCALDGIAGRDFNKRMVNFMNNMACFDKSYKISSYNL